MSASEAGRLLTLPSLHALGLQATPSAFYFPALMQINPALLLRSALFAWLPTLEDLHDILAIGGARAAALLMPPCAHFSPCPASPSPRGRPRKNARENGPWSQNGIAFIRSKTSISYMYQAQPCRGSVQGLLSGSHALVVPKLLGCVGDPRARFRWLR